MNIYTYCKYCVRQFNVQLQPQAQVTKLRMDILEATCDQCQRPLGECGAELWISKVKLTTHYAYYFCIVQT
jgi:hypothetical protein